MSDAAKEIARRFREAQALFSAMNWEESIPEFRRILALDPTIKTARINLAYALNNLGVSLEKSGKLEDAANLYHEAKALLPEFDQPYFHLGRCYSRQEKWQDAAECYKEASSLAPHSAESFYRLAVAEGHLESKEWQIIHLREAVRLEPENTLYRWNLGGYLSMSGRSQEGIRELQECLRLDPKYPQAHFVLGLAFYRVDQYAQAIPLLWKSIRLKPFNWDRWDLLWRALLLNAVKRVFR